VLRVARVAPWASLVVLCGLSTWMPSSVHVGEEAVLQRQRIAAAMAAVPFFVGEWVGRDEQVPPEAQKLLRPNAIFSRTYQKPGGPGLHLLLVHCSDARDMIGHYPPICYPSSGWVAEDVPGPAEGVLHAGEGELPVRLYGFRRMHERGRVDRIIIFSAFILPGGAVSRDIDRINRQSERLEISVQGVAQLQVIVPAALGRANAVAAANDLLGGLEELLRALQVGAAKP
jgi:hypothetical protein